jgi:NADP-dependent 3-hydroxy acid dehydrogenase YdfG
MRLVRVYFHALRATYRSSRQPNANGGALAVLCLIVNAAYPHAEEDFTMRLSGKIALVTGSSSGIGRAIALRFAREGADVIINGRDERKIAGVVKEAEAFGRRALGIRANVGSFAESRAMVERARAELGHLDILVCSAGVFHHTPFLKMSEEEWDEVLTVDLKGLFNCTRAAIAHMAERKWGRIIFITATSGINPPASSAFFTSALLASTYWPDQFLSRFVAPRFPQLCGCEPPV